MTITKDKQNKKNALVIQHNNLVEARYSLSLPEKRILNWLISRIKPEDEELEEYDITQKELCEVFNVKGDHLYKMLDLVTDKLMGRFITIRSLKTGNWEKIHLVGRASYKDGVLRIGFDRYIKPYILQQKDHFTKIRLGDVMMLKSFYAIRLYELFKQYEPIGKREITIEELRNIFELNSEYTRYNDFKKKVIDNPIKEINAKTDLFVDFEEIKRARKVIAFEFCIKKNPNYGKTEFEKSQTEKTSLIQKELRSANSLIEEIMELGFSRASSRHFLKKDSEETVRSALKAIKLQIERGHVRNPKAMFIVAVNEKWSPEIFVTKKTAP